MNASSALNVSSQTKPASGPPGEAGTPPRTQTGSSHERGHEKVFTPLVRQFLDYLRLEKHFSGYTVKSFGADRIQFGQFLGGDIGPASNVAGRTIMSPDDVDARK